MPVARSWRGWLVDICVGLVIRFALLPATAFLFPLSDPPSSGQIAHVLWRINTFEVRWAVSNVPARPWVFITGVAGMVATAVVYGIVVMFAVRASAAALKRRRARLLRD